jgi:hypothetical protein
MLCGTNTIIGIVREKSFYNKVKLVNTKRERERERERGGAGEDGS